MKTFLSRTKESSLPRYRDEKPSRVIFWILGAFLALVLLTDILGRLGGAVITPFYAVRHYLEYSTATVPTFFRDRMELLAEIRELEERLRIEEGKDTRAAFSAEENEELRGLLSASGAPRIAAGVISRPPFSPYDTLIIDRGSQDGISEYAPVFGEGDRAIGYVRSVFEKSALITLFSSPGSESMVYLFGPDIFTTARGEGGGVVRVSVPQGLPVAEGDLAVLPSLEGGILGMVDYVQSTPTEPEQHAFIVLDTPLQSIRLVSVGTTPIRPTTYEEAEDEVREAERALFFFEVPAGAPSATATPTTTTPETSLP